MIRKNLWKRGYLVRHKYTRFGYFEKNPQTKVMIALANTIANSTAPIIRMLRRRFGVGSRKKIRHTI